jgi:hypothetical protein
MQYLDFLRQTNVTPSQTMDYYCTQQVIICDMFTAKRCDRILAQWK